MITDSNNTKTVMQTSLPLPLISRGKVRDIYAVSENKLLVVTTDRLSAFDVILPNPIPYKGKVLNQISAFWFDFLSDIVPNHLITANMHEMDLPQEIIEKYVGQIEGRSMLVRRAQPLPIECVVRGYVTGSGWKDYLQTGAVCGHKLKEGLKQCEKLAEPIFTPATKATEGHDMNIDRGEAGRLTGEDVAKKVEDISIRLYEKGRDFADAKGIIIADTKFEFGHFGDDLILIDEALSPDSSRFWPKDQYADGRDQASFDKQIVRNYLLGIDWDQKPPAPSLPDEVVARTSRAYRDVYKRLVGEEIK
ncbi:MAG: phosphoribosylaminoimidazolesuccinocarboxamide synthase [Candidatus Omnitrophota bacterium]|nr:phosphoribosylaminoimidazolesuccinocarboxamide synthase [Candidatus Omnitrophota bacterium]